MIGLCPGRAPGKGQSEFSGIVVRTGGNAAMKKLGELMTILTR